MNLVDDTLKASVRTAQLDLFETFRRAEPFTFYKPSEESVIISNPNFNSDLQEFNNPVLTTQSRQFFCRVLFPKRESTFYNSIPDAAVQMKVEQDFAEVTIQFEADAHEYIKDCTRFTFMGENYQKLGSIRKLGILDTFVLFQLYLKKVN